MGRALTCCQKNKIEGEGRKLAFTDDVGKMKKRSSYLIKLIPQSFGCQQSFQSFNHLSVCHGLISLVNRFPGYVEILCVSGMGSTIVSCRHRAHVLLLSCHCIWHFLWTNFLQHGRNTVPIRQASSSTRQKWH